MEIRHLEYFMEVARHKSFSKAADSSYVSQPSISKAIKELEEQLGTTLFYRNTKSVELTDAGAAVLAEAEQIVSSFRNIRARLEGLTNLQEGRIHIGLPPITAVTSFSYLLGGFKKAYPNIHIHLYESGPKKVEAAVQEGLLDIGIFTPDPGSEDVFGHIWFEEDPLCVIFPPNHPLAAGGAVSYSAIRKQPMVLYDSSYKLHDLILARCKEAGFTPDIVFETSQRELMIQMVAAGLGIALLPRKICKTLSPELLEFRPLADTELCLRLAIAWRKERYQSHATRALLEYARTHEDCIPHE